MDIEAAIFIPPDRPRDLKAQDEFDDRSCSGILIIERPALPNRVLNPVLP
jgi:hypothetical protein